ncbi:hypothetical protein V5O48_005650 [Marasmius crinis-equi]|uniref:MYND-type domain-containing protein n=1 Tax=Marasmius crinis-equi TaxID=585013 RepID=A0ABR3FMK5_9AGAR
MVDPRVPQSLHHLVANAKSTYRNSRMATNRLRELGLPSASLENGSSSILLNESTDVALHVIAALQSAYDTSPSKATSTFEQIRSHWDLLSVWIQHLLEGAVLSEDEPLSRESFAAFEHILILLPPFLDSHFRAGEINTESLNHQSPLFFRLIVRTWFKTLEIHHWTYGAWSLLLTRLAVLSSSTSWFLPGSDSAQGDATLQQGLTFARHLSEQLQHIPGMTPSDYRAFLAFLCCPALEESHPFCPVVPDCTLPVLVRTLAVVTRKRKQIRKARVKSDEYVITMGITFQLLSYLSSFTQEPYFAAEALDAGLLRVLLRPHSCFLRTDDPTIPLVRKYHYLATEIIDRIARLLLFPAILRRFWRACERVTPYLDMDMATKLPMLWESWNRARQKAWSLHAFRRALKDRVSPLCNYCGCPGKAEGTDSHLLYLRCLGCKLTAYCSRKCQKLDWKHGGHRARCKLDSLSPDVRPSMIHQEQNFLHELSLHLISSHLDVVTKDLDAFVTALRQSNHPDKQAEERMIVDGEKSPVIIIDLQKPERPSAQDIRVFGFGGHAVELYPHLNSGWEEALVNHWRTEAHVSNENILVATLIPNHVGYGRPLLWTSMILLDLPLVEPLRFSVPNESFTRNGELNR